MPGQAPMAEPAKAPGASPPSKAELTLALQGREVEELREMAKRLSKSCKDLELLLDDLKVEQQTLQDDKAQLTETIELMMRELKKTQYWCRKHSGTSACQRDSN
mmetsp:Transcript_23842/g.52650  ORF Transcript_23842/g.52650 Transcript_23842/m.52650 type:complete len:104 (-) Transcript_23842:925-1236(-)